MKKKKKKKTYWRPFIIFTYHAKERLIQRIKEQNIHMSTHAAMRRIGLILSKLRNLKNGEYKKFRRLKWEFGNFTVVLVEHTYTNKRYIITIAFE